MTTDQPTPPTSDAIDALAELLRSAGVEVGYANGDQFRKVVARRLLGWPAAMAASLPDDVMLAELVKRGTLTEERREWKQFGDDGCP